MLRTFHDTILFWQRTGLNILQKKKCYFSLTFASESLKSKKNLIISTLILLKFLIRTYWTWGSTLRSNSFGLNQTLITLKTLPTNPSSLTCFTMWLSTLITKSFCLKSVTVMSAWLWYLDHKDKNIFLKFMTIHRLDHSLSFVLICNFIYNGAASIEKWLKL